MKRCFVMFGFVVLMLVWAVLTEKNEVIINDKMVESELETERQLTNEIVSEDVLRN